MKKKYFRNTTWAVLLMAAVLAWFCLPKQPQVKVESVQMEQGGPKLPTPSIQKTAPVSNPTPSKKNDAIITQERASEKELWNLWLVTPISFYGKVLDEKGTPIQGAKVVVSIHDHILNGNTRIELLSDDGGRFSVKGHGLGLGVMVSKIGYYRLTESAGTFGYAQGAETGRPHPDPSDPAIFVLRKMGVVEPLIKKATGGSLSKNGVPTEINLQLGKKVSAGQGDVRIECWINDQGIEPNSNKSFDWKCRISAKNGGVSERKGEFDFEAPADGYQQSVEIDMPKSAGNQWQDSIEKDFFLKLANGCFARIHFRMNAGGAQTFHVINYLNPRPGSRNLEYDTAQQSDAR